MNPFQTARIGKQDAWVWPVSGLSLVLGLLIAMAWATQERRNAILGKLTDADLGQRIATGTIDVQTQALQLQGEVAKLRREKTDLENALASQSGQAKVLNQGLQDAKEFACLTELQGPGIEVTLRDSPKAQAQTADLPYGVPSPYVIHDLDVLKVVNELFNAGAEAVSVNNRRVGPGTWIRCVGTVAQVDGVPLSSPVVIRAIGDQTNLMSAMQMPGNILQEFKQTDPDMAAVDEVKQVSLPAYSGSTLKRFSSIPKGGG